MANKTEEKKSKVTTVTEFIKHYSSLSSDSLKEKYLNSHMVRKYCPILQKRALQEVMFEKSKTQTEDGIAYIDMVTSKINFVMSVIALYTDQVIDRDEDGNLDVVKVYDMLAESGMLDLIFDYVGEDEISEMTFVQDILMQRFELEAHSVQAMLLQLVDRFGQMFGLGLGYVQDALKNNPEIENNIKKFQDGMKKR